MHIYNSVCACMWTMAHVCIEVAEVTHRVGYGATGNDQGWVQHCIISLLESFVLVSVHLLYVSLFHFLFSRVFLLGSWCSCNSW